MRRRHVLHDANHMPSLNYHVWVVICQGSTILIYFVLFKGHTSVRQVLTLTGSWVRRTDATGVFCARGVSDDGLM